MGSDGSVVLVGNTDIDENNYAWSATKLDINGSFLWDWTVGDDQHLNRCRRNLTNGHRTMRSALPLALVRTHHIKASRTSLAKSDTSVG